MATRRTLFLAPVLIILLGFLYVYDSPRVVKYKEYIPRYISLPYQEIRGKYVVLYNFLRGTQQFRGDEAVTYATHCDITFLHNIEEVAKRYDGPISLTVYCPGTDYMLMIESITHLVQCRHENIRKLVTFHLMFDMEEIPHININSEYVHNSTKINCKRKPPYARFGFKSYKTLAKLTYPINTARNVAVLGAKTALLMSVDIELIPPRKFSERFVKFYKKRFQNSRRKVFVMPVFELRRNVIIPESRKDLAELYKSKKAQIFHFSLCESCHKIPNFSYDDWMSSEVEAFGVNGTRKRTGIWEPPFVGSKVDPLYDERLSWEGQSDRLPQLYAMCLLKYDFLLLNDAFLVHAPGIKSGKEEVQPRSRWLETYKFIKDVVKKDVDRLYGGKRSTGRCQIVGKI